MENKINKNQDEKLVRLLYQQLIENWNQQNAERNGQSFYS